MYKESLIYPLRATQRYSSSARWTSNVHNGSPQSELVKFTTLGRSIYSYSMNRTPFIVQYITILYSFFTTYYLHWSGGQTLNNNSHFSWNCTWQWAQGCLDLISIKLERNEIYDIILQVWPFLEGIQLQSMAYCLY